MTVAEDKFSKLPELAKPSVYDLYLKPCLKTFTCPGKTDIHLEITKKTNFLKLYANELDINSASIELGDGSVLNNLTVELDKKWMLLTVKLPKEIEPQNAKLSFDFACQINNTMHGFSRSTYKDQQGNEKFMASTQFESTYARQVFPCWDEPVYKAKFNVTLEVEDSLTALSNMNIVEEKKTGGGTKVVKYASTPLMSTYLVAFAVGDLEYIQAFTNKGIDVKVYTVPGKKQQGQFALDLAVKSLDWYDEWFDIACPLPKCDLIAIPDFSMGAMENWGLITYREVCLLVEQGKTSTIVKSHVALVVAHEVAHFWFGNLVTMKWWTDLWIKEGFANFMMYVLVGYKCPEFKIWEQFVKDETADGFDLDGLRSSHPIEIEIDNPNELDEIYDQITYAKSTCINRMLCNHLGENVFRDGLRNYLKKFQYSNAVTKDLWNCHREVSDQDIDALMSSWTKQMGYPLVEVQQKIDGTKRILKLKQSRFIADGGKDELNSFWQVPIGIITGEQTDTPKFKVILGKHEDEVIIEGVQPNQWIKLNAGLSGFYRVQYSPEMLEALIPAIKSKQLGVIDRFNVANDFVALFESNKLQATDFLKFCTAFENEDEYIVWSAIAGGLGCISHVLEHHENDKVSKQFDAFVCKLMEPVANKLGWEEKQGEDQSVGLLRALVLGRLSKSGHEPTIEKAIEKFVDHVENNTNLNADLRSMIFCTAGRANSTELIGKLQKIFETVGFSEIENNCLVAMGTTTDKDLLTAVYDYGIAQGKARMQDYVRIFAGSQGSKEGRAFAWDYFKTNMKKLLESFCTVNNTQFQRILKITASDHCSEAYAKDVEEFCKANFDAYALGVLDRPIRQSTERIRLNERLLLNNANGLAEFLLK